MEGLLDTLLCILILKHKKVANGYYVTGQEPNGALGVTDVLGHLSRDLEGRVEGRHSGSSRGLQFMARLVPERM